MSAPAFILEAETSTFTATTPKTTAAFNILGRDVLVAYAMSENSTTVLTISNSGTALAWIQQQVVAVSGFCWLSIWTHEVTQSRAGLTVSLASGGTGSFGGDVLLVRDSAGVGASAKANAVGAAPTMNLTTTVPNSLVVVANADFTAGSGARTWRSNAGTLTETTYVVSAGLYTAYGGYHADAGPVATYAVGLTAPSQTYSIAAIEVKGYTPPIIMTYWRVRLRG